MPYIFISTQIRLECGPTICGDEFSDPELMEFLGAKLHKQLGNNLNPRKVMCYNYIYDGAIELSNFIKFGRNPRKVMCNMYDEDQMHPLCREYRTTDVPRIVLNKLEERGYNVAGVTGLGQTMVWTMFKPAPVIMD